MSATADDGRSLLVGVAGFVVVHLLGLVALGEPSLPALVVVEGLAVAALVGGEALTTRDLRGAGLVVVSVLGTLVAVGQVLAVTAPWVVAVGLVLAGGSALYLVHQYDRSVAGGDAA